MSIHKNARKITTHVLQAMKSKNEKIAMLTAYDYSMAKIVDQAGIDVILVGDSAANVMAGYDSTLPLTLDEIDSGLREALRVGSERVVKQVGLENGYYKDNNIHIPLPRSIKKADKFARQIGLDKTFRDLEKQINRAAEQAAPLAKTVFRDAILEMTLSDVRNILDGPDDAATRYFEHKMTPQLSLAMRPIVDESLNQVGAVRIYNDLAQQFSAIPFAPNIDTDLSGYVLEKGISGLFYYLALEEAAIRKDPAKQTTAILKRVFGGQ